VEAWRSNAISKVLVLGKIDGGMSRYGLADGSYRLKAGPRLTSFARVGPAYLSRRQPLYDWEVQPKNGWSKG